MYKTPVDLIQRALDEDGAYADITTLSTVPASQWSEARILTRQDGVLAGLALAIETFHLFDRRIEAELVSHDGVAVEAGRDLILLQGPARSILSAERVALNFVGRLAGIATLTARCVAAVEGTRARILDTRKMTPGLRALEKMAVQAGGGQNHRFGLSDGILIKDNHIKASGGILQAIMNARGRAPHLLKIEVECETIQEVEEALQAKADVILLDNMDLPLMRAAVDFIRVQAPTVLIEASGNIGTNVERLAAVAQTGVDFISLGAITHSVTNFDVSLEFVG